jgi:hypothetical protein
MALPRPVRHRCDLLGRLDRPGDDPVQVRVIDLSENGAFIQEAPGLEDIQVGDEAELVVALPGGFWTAGVLVTRIGTTRVDVDHKTVQHITISATGFGLEFTEMPEDQLERLRACLEQLDER